MRKSLLNNLLKILLAVLLAANLAVGVTSLRLDAVAGSAADPLVTKSYVDKLIDEVKALVGGGSASSDGGGAEVYVPLYVGAGQIVYGAGGTEIVLRAGTAAAFVPGENGLLDVSDGIDMPHGYPLSVNHMVIIPRDDGRGVIALTDCWFMVKGGYGLPN